MAEEGSPGAVKRFHLLTVLTIRQGLQWPCLSSFNSIEIGGVECLAGDYPVGKSDIELVRSLGILGSQMSTLLK